MVSMKENNKALIRRRIDEGLDLLCRPGEPHQLEGIRDFLDFVDQEGTTNREKIASRQRILRRVETTDPGVSCEDSDAAPACGEWPAGVVLEDGRLIGFGIHIFNEDIYPLQSFEIYLRGCGLSGSLDLSGQGDLLFVDIYHNKVSRVDLSGDKALRILGIQDNLVETLDVSELEACQGIDAGKNRLSRLDVSRNRDLAELYVNDNRLSEIDLTGCPESRISAARTGSITSSTNTLPRRSSATASFSGIRRSFTVFTGPS